jgi:hypothetical protein
MLPMRVVTAASLVLACGMATAVRAQEIKLSDCPPAVRKTFEAEARGAKIGAIRKEKEGDETVYWTEVAVDAKAYAIGVLEDGTLTEMNLAVDDADLPIDRCPAEVQATFRREAFGEKLESVGKDRKYGVPVYQTVVHHKGKSYEIVVAEDGTLVEKVLVIEDEEVELAKCPNIVQVSLRQHAKGGTIVAITRSSGISHPTFEAEVKIKDKVYFIEIAENGLLISKSLEAGEE